MNSFLSSWLKYLHVFAPNELSILTDHPHIEGGKVNPFKNANDDDATSINCPSTLQGLMAIKWNPVGLNSLIIEAEKGKAVEEQEIPEGNL